MGRGYRDSYHTPNDEFYPERLLLLKVSQAIKRKSPRRDTCSNTSSYLVGFTINQLHSDPNNYRLMVIHEEYAFSHFSDPHSLQWSIHCSNVQSLFRQRYLVISENKLHLSNIQWHRIPFMYQKTEMETVRDDWTKQRLKHSRTNIKSCSSVSDAWGFRLKGLRWPYPCNFSYISLFGYFYPLYVATSPWKMSHSLDI